MAKTTTMTGMATMRSQVSMVGMVKNMGES
jgi:hypothetical protein